MRGMMVVVGTEESVRNWVNDIMVMLIEMLTVPRKDYSFLYKRRF